MANATAGLRVAAALVLMAAVLLAAAGLGDALHLDNKQVKIRTMGDVTRMHAMFTKKDAPSISPPGNGQSYIHVEASFERPDVGPLPDGSVDIAIIPASTSAFGVAVAGHAIPRACCRPSDVDKSLCPTANRLAVRSRSADEEFFTHSVRFENQSTKATASLRFRPPRTGLYYLVYANCDATLGAVEVTSHSEWMNPYGQLPGESYGFYPFFGVLACVSLLALAAWAFQMIRWRRDLLHVQWWLTAFLVSEVVQNITWFAIYLGENYSGDILLAPNIFGMLLETATDSLARVLMLMLAMGYGVVKPTLGSTMYQVVGLGLLYFVCASGMAVSEMVGRLSPSVPPLAQAVDVFLIFPRALIDTTFFWWSFLSVVRTTSQLEQRGQDLKLKMYKLFFLLLVVTGVVSALILIYMIFYNLFTPRTDQWRSEWFLTEAVWDLQYMALLLAMAWLWRPTDNNVRYGYTPTVDDVVVEVALQPLPPSVGEMLSKRTRVDDPTGSGGIGGGGGGGGGDGVVLPSQYDLEAAPTTRGVRRVGGGGAGSGRGGDSGETEYTFALNIEDDEEGMPSKME